MTAKKSDQLQVRLETDTLKKFRQLTKEGGAGAAEYARRLIELAVEWADRKGHLPSPPAVTEKPYLKSLEAEILAWTAGAETTLAVSETKSLKNLATALLQLQVEKNTDQANAAAHKSPPTPP